MASPINSVSSAKRRRQDEVLPISDDDATDLTFPRFLVVSANDGQPIKYSVFAIQKILQCAVGDVKTAKKLYNGSVLIEVSTKQESSKALTMSTWIDTPITVTAHRSLNSCRCVIRCRDFRDCGNDEILISYTLRELHNWCCACARCVSLVFLICLSHDLNGLVCVESPLRSHSINQSIKQLT